MISDSTLIELFSKPIKWGRDMVNRKSERRGEEAPWVPVLSDRDLEYSSR
jgi:hypothetical protein